MLIYKSINVMRVHLG